MLCKIILISIVIKLFLTDLANCVKFSDEMIVETEYLRIKGSLSFSRQLHPFYEFKGISYANVVKRFQPAEPISEFKEETLDGNKFGAVCPQNFRADFNENCLFLNVYLPIRGVDDMPVIVYVHGGSLADGAGSSIDPKYFMDKNAIFVTINYRLGAFGFLTIGHDKEIVPNLGLKDTVLALKWIQKNIKAFGGNKNKVTLMSQSAGSLISSLLLFAPSAKGLFNRVILHSCAILDPWLIRNKSDNDEMGHMLIKALNCDSKNDDKDEIINCLMAKTPEEIIKAQGSLRLWYNNPIIPFSPIIEKEGPNAFIWEDPLVSLIEGRFNRVPVIMTVTKDEGILLQAIDAVTNEKELREYNDNWNNVVDLPLALSLDQYSKFSTLEPEQQNFLKKSIREAYFGADELVYSPTIDQKTFKGLTKLFSDRNFNYGALKTAEALSRFVPVYTGIFTKPGNVSMTKLFGVTQVFGVSHGDDLQYFFPEFGYGPFPLSKELTDISKALVRTWVSFASGGVPYIEIKDDLETQLVKWPRVGGGYKKNHDVEWVDLGKVPHELAILKKPFGNRLDFWDAYYDIVSKY